MARILVIDDDSSVATSIRMMLEYEDYEVVVADNGLSGVEAAAAASFDAAIVDIFMPGMNGLQAIKAIRQCRPNLPIIAISGFTVRAEPVPGTAALAAALELGADCSLHKPFRRRDILGAVAACLDGSIRRARDRTPATAHVPPAERALL